MDREEFDDFQGARTRFDIVIVGRLRATPWTKRDRRLGKGLCPTEEVGLSRNIQHGDKERALFSSARPTPLKRY